MSHSSHPKKIHQELFNQLNDCVFVHDLEGNLLDVNDTLVDNFGYSRDELLDMELKDLVTSEEREKAGGGTHYIEGKQSGLYKTFYETKEGERIPVEVNYNFIDYQEENAVLKVVREIKEREKKRKKAESKLKKKTRQLKRAQELANLGYWEMEIETGDAYWSDEFFRICGYEPQSFEPTSEKGFEIIHPDDRERAEKELNRAIEEESDYRIEKRIQRPDGEVRHVLSVGKIINTENNKPKKLSGYFLDITERKEAEKNLKKSKKKYEELSEEFELILDHLPGLVFYKDTENNFLRVNKKLAEAHDMTKEELEGTSLFDLYSEEEAQEYWEDDKEVIQNEEPKLNIVEPWSTDEEKRWMETSKIPYVVNNEVKGIIGISSDITERKKAKEMKDLLHSLLRHDIRNKSQAILGYLQLLEDFNLKDDGKKYLQNAQKGVKNQLDLIEKVSILRKAQKEQIEKIDLSSTINEAIDSEKELAKEKGIKIESKCPGTGCEVKGGPLLKQAFSNIIENSIQHSNAEKIRINRKQKQEEIICVIEDDGVGIPDKEKEKILNKGYTTDKERGSGLGLFLVKTLIEMYKGETKVKDSELGGARFDIHLQKP